MSRQDIAGTLASVRLFRGADAGFFARVAQQPRARLGVKAGEAIYEAGDPADAVFVAIAQNSGTAGPRGIVELSLPTSDAGHQSHVEHIVSGDGFGEFEFVAAGLGGGRAIRRSSARAIVGADLYRIPYALLAPLLAEADAVRARLIKLSFDRLMSALNVKSTQLLGDRDVAFANWLIEAADNLGIAEGRHVRFSRTIGQREIAEALGVTRETMSLRLNEWERAGLLNTGGQSQRLEILDYPRVALRAAVDKGAAREAIDAAIAEVDADLARGDLIRARNIGLDMLMFFPASPDLRHRVALANIRAGNTREALAGLAHGGYATGGDIAVLRGRVARGLRDPATTPERLFFGNGEAAVESEADLSDDLDEIPELTRRLAVLVEDIAAIEARAQKELAFAAGDPEARHAHAAASAEYYESIHAAVGGTYAGINAAMMARIAGDDDRSAAIAGRIIRLIGREPKGYWDHATLAEAHLLTGDDAAAARAFALAHRQADATDGHRSSTRLQLARIGAHLGIPTEACLAALPVGLTAVYSGPLFRGAELDDSAQQRLEGDLRSAVDAALATEGVRYIYGALACGADIVVAEAALAAGVELHVVLPFPVDAFVATSVDIGNPADAPDRWKERFWHCLRQSASFTSLVERPPETRQLDAHYFHAFKLAAGLALLRSDALSSRAVMIAVDDGRAAVNVAGAQAAASGWSAANLPLVSIPIAMDRKTAAAPSAQTDTFRPVVFLWPVNEPVDLPALARAAGKAAGVAVNPISRTSRDRRAGTALAVETIGEALDLLQALVQEAAGAPQPVRIIADFGPATDARGAASDAAISRLSGASDMIGLPASVAIATLTFAARARAEPGVAGCGFIPIGRTAIAAAEKGGDGRPLPSRDVYAISFQGRTSGKRAAGKRRPR
jgi:CRP-like cAMP-binding protein